MRAFLDILVIILYLLFTITDNQLRNLSLEYTVIWAVKFARFWFIRSCLWTGCYISLSVILFTTGAQVAPSPIPTTTESKEKLKGEIYGI